MEATIQLTTLLITALPIVAAVVVAVLKLTSWGRANQEALDEVMDAVGQARRLQAPINNVVDVMKQKRPTMKKRTIKQLDRAALRRDPTGGIHE